MSIPPLHPAPDKGTENLAPMVADRIYDGCTDLLLETEPTGIILPSVPSVIALRIILDILSVRDQFEADIPPERLGQAVAYITERVRALLPDAWRTEVLDGAADDILRHTERILQGETP